MYINIGTTAAKVELLSPSRRRRPQKCAFPSIIVNVVVVVVVIDS